MGDAALACARLHGGAWHIALLAQACARFKCGAEAGTVVAGGQGRGDRLDQLADPSGVAVVPSVWIWTTWSPSLHGCWPLADRRLVEVLLQCQLRDPPTSIGSIGPLLSTHVLPFVLPRRLLRSSQHFLADQQPFAPQVIDEIVHI